MSKFGIFGITMRIPLSMMRQIDCRIRTILDNLFEKFRKHCKPTRELSLDEAMITWQGRLRFRMYNPGKLVKYGILVSMVYEATTGCIGNMEIYTAGSWRKQCFLAWDRTSTYGAMFTRITVIIVLKLQKSYS
jgi:hypothetical protein